MNLTLLLPSQVFIRKSDVTRLVVITSQGAWGLWPHRQDCVAALIPGILTLECQGEVTYIAVDGGVMVKVGPEVQISVRRALSGADLQHLRDTVEHEYRGLTETEREVRHVSEKLESGFLRRMVALHHD